MKAFFTVTEDSLSRRMGIFKLTFTLYTMCKLLMAKERRRTASSFTIFSIDVTGNAGVFVWFFFKLFSYPCQQEPHYCRHGKS